VKAFDFVKIVFSRFTVGWLAGVDVMITFFAIFANFWRKMAFFSKTNVIINFLQEQAVI
jgi:hypothetical protein